MHCIIWCTKCFCHSQLHRAAIQYFISIRCAPREHIHTHTHTNYPHDIWRYDNCMPLNAVCRWIVERRYSQAEIWNITFVDATDFDSMQRKINIESLRVTRVFVCSLSLSLLPTSPSLSPFLHFTSSIRASFLAPAEPKTEQLKNRHIFLVERTATQKATEMEGASKRRSEETSADTRGNGCQQPKRFVSFEIHQKAARKRHVFPVIHDKNDTNVFELCRWIGVAKKKTESRWSTVCTSINGGGRRGEDKREYLHRYPSIIQIEKWHSLRLS